MTHTIPLCPHGAALALCDKCPSARPQSRRPLMLSRDEVVILLTGAEILLAIAEGSADHLTAAAILRDILSKLRELKK